MKKLQKKRISCSFSLSESTDKIWVATKKMQIKALHVSSLYQTITNNVLGYGCQAPWIFVVQNVDEIANTNQRRL